MAVVMTAASGYDLGYVWHGAGHASERTAGGYYLNASLQGEAPGRWFGRGAALLGLAGQVDRSAYDALNAQLDPRTGVQLDVHEVKWVPWPPWMIPLAPGPRESMVMPGALVARSARWAESMARPTTRRDQASSTTQQYTLPSRVGVQ